MTKSLCHVARCRSVGLIGGVKRVSLSVLSRCLHSIRWTLPMQKYVKDALETPVDIAVATPESLLRYRLEGT